MKLCLVTQEYPPETAKGGIGTQAASKAQGFRNRGHEVHVLSRSVDGAAHDEVRDGIHIVRVPNASPRFPIHTMTADWIVHSTYVAAALGEIHAAHDLDLVEFPEWAAEGFVHFLNRTPWNRLTSIVQIHGSLAMHAGELGWPKVETEDYRTGTFMESTCLRLADAIYTSSAFSARYCEKAYGLDAANIPTIHTGVDTKRFCPSAEKDDRPTIIFVGRIVPNKGVEVLVEAAAALVSEVPGLKLSFLGRGEERLIAGLRSRAAKAQDLLDFRGFVSREDLPHELSRAHVFAMPSFVEPGPGLVYLEAMACGLPVIGCTAGGTPEIIADGKDGLLVPPRDVHALAAALRRLLQDPALRAAMGKQARARVIVEADSTHCLDRIESFYRDVVGRSRSLAEVGP